MSGEGVKDEEGTFKGDWARVICYGINQMRGGEPEKSGGVKSTRG